MSEKLQRKHPQQTQRPRPDSSPFLPPGYAVQSKHSGSPTTQGDRISGSETIYNATNNNALNNAAALFATGKQHGGVGVKGSPGVSGTAAVSGTVSTMSSLPSHRFQQSVRSPENARGAQQGHTHMGATDGAYANDDPLLIRTSLFDPHPIIIPPPGSRLAFAGATSREMIHKFRSLPSFDDALLRRAKSPLCLYNYWQYLSDTEACPEELEFWLSLADYEELYRRFVQAEETMPIPVSPHGSEQERTHLRPFGTAGGQHLGYGRVESGALGTISGTRRERPVDNLDKETQELDKYLGSLSQETARAAKNSSCQQHRQCTQMHRPFTHAHATGRPTLDAPARPIRRTGLSGFFSRIFSGEPASMDCAGVAGVQWGDHAQENQDMPLLSPSVSEPKQNIEAPTEEDMRRSVEKLYFHYILPGAPAEMYIGTQMRDEIASRIEKDGRFDPDLFAPAKRHAYESMRNESYLRFLRERLLHNTTRGTAAPRIVLGLALIFVALTFQLTLVFLDVKPKGWRWLPLAGLWPGFIFAFAGVSRLDPFLAMLGRFEPVAWHFEAVRDSAIRDSHLKRASLQLIATAVIAVVISLVLFLVPGNHI
ncbi:Bud site selection protein, Revert to axial protein 1 [Coemansia sp. RSA 2599]|nr:Bud site selection protein, Revert to axial protein 1 [Coemansia sp. RSA 2599]